ncbi:MAG: hypothetical protein KA163_04815 [Bacteroidia bacterium]|nr:hypothetical protein [Bacteroidia bacterium]
MGEKQHRFYLSVIFLFCILALNAQHTTINKSGEKAPAPGKHKIMLIPFEPRLYMSEIDYALNKESKLSGKQIKALFRDGINEQLYKSLKAQHQVVDLMDDTIKTKKDLAEIYQHLVLEYMKVPDQKNYKPPVKEKQEQTIKNGQIIDESNTDQRFMNAKINTPGLVPHLYKTYKSDIFVFINQLDIKASNSGGPADAATTTTDGFRKLVVHYTVYTFDAKEINSGIAETQFPAALNDPKKIVSGYFSKLAQIITERINLALAAPKAK